MENGQLGTQVQQRFIFIWEGAFAAPPLSRSLEFLLRKFRRFDDAVSLWDIHHLVASQVWYLRVHTPYACDLAVTTREIGFGRAVARRIGLENIPIRYVFCTDPETLGRKLPYQPDVIKVFYGLDSQRWAYGARGYCVPPEGRGFQALA